MLEAFTCRKVRTYLESVVGGNAAAPDPQLWRELTSRGVVDGDPVHPRITPTGKHTLRELQVRAYRVDPLPVSAVEAELVRTLEEFDGVARSTEYFLSELGPITPNEALPLLRPLAVGLANRRAAPEDVAEAFRQIWGMVEVLGGSSIDRLLAAEIICAFPGSLDKTYARVVNLADRLRDRLGVHGAVNASAAILAVGSSDDSVSPLDLFYSIRSQVPTDEGAALLATDTSRARERLESRKEHRAQWKGVARDNLDAECAATFLALSDVPANVTRANVSELASELTRHFGARPLVPSAILASRSTLASGELSDWLAKAVVVLRERKLAPNEAELSALALALVHGLHPESFLTEESWETRSAEALRAPPADLPTLVALHAWVYRPLVIPVGRTQPVSAASA